MGVNYCVGSDFYRGRLCTLFGRDRDGCVLVCKRRDRDDRHWVCLVSSVYPALLLGSQNAVLDCLKYHFLIGGDKDHRRGGHTAPAFTLN